MPPEKPVECSAMTLPQGKSLQKETTVAWLQMLKHTVFNDFYQKAGICSRANSFYYLNIYNQICKMNV